MNKIFRKMTAVLLLCAMLATLAACGNTDSTSSSTSSGTSVSSTVSGTESETPEESEAQTSSETASEVVSETASEAASQAASEAASQAAESGDPAPMEHVMKGASEGATMNTLGREADGGSITFTSGGDTNLDNMPNGLKIGDKVSVMYTGNIEGTDGSKVNVTRVNPVKNLD